MMTMMRQVAIVIALTMKTSLSFQQFSFAVPPLGSRIGKNVHQSGLVVLSSSSSSSSSSSNDATEDWRDIRAKLVMQYDMGENTVADATAAAAAAAASKEGTNATATTTTTTTTTSTATTKTPSSAKTTKANNRWAYDAGDLIEVGSLIVSHPSQDWRGLQKQHFHKCIILVIEHSREGTKGIILNRKLQLQGTNGDNDNNNNNNNNDDNDNKNNWNSYFGGNTQGMGSEDESLGCLYRLNDLSRVTIGMAVRILNDIAIMPLDIAQCLVDEKEANQEDFRLYHGYTTWGPGQLEKELKRGDWFVAATDTESLWDTIVQEPAFSTGTDKWVQIMKRIGKESLIASTPNQKFEDAMLRQYMRLRLLEKDTKASLQRSGSRSRSPRSSGSEKQTNDERPSPDNLAPGTLVRSSTPILLDEQVFHQSLVLILQNDAEMTIGVVLNRPHSTSVSIGGTELPIRYGGRFELDDEGIPELWFHCNHLTLQEARIGEPISVQGTARSIFWKCTRKDAETAIKVGLANADDFLVVSGLSVWKKEDFSQQQQQQQQHEGDESSRSRSHIELEDCFSKVDEKSIDTIWKLLMVQEPLNKKNAADNLEAANTAWMLSGDAGWMLSGGSQQFNSRSRTDTMDTKEQRVVQNLAYSALDRWIRTYLLKP
eukprot:jgi/Psemu1/8665/gm1.8665_g